MESSDNEEVGVVEGVQETREQMLDRHKREVRNFMDKKRMLSKKTKGKARVEELNARMQQEEMDMQYRHRQEETAMDEYEAEHRETEGDAGSSGNAGAAETTAAASAEDDAQSREQAEKEAAERRIAKAQRKRGKKAAKEADRQRMKEEINKNVVNMRAVELDQINNLLKDDELQVKEVQADGHCMYRAIADQLKFAGDDSMGEAQFGRLRTLAASYMREHVDDFNPFLGLTDEEYAAYCDKVEHTAEWGGQLELQALSSALERPIWVFAAGAPLLRMGVEHEGAQPLKVTFHRHYYALGEHYNSVARIA